MLPQMFPLPWIIFFLLLFFCYFCVVIFSFFFTPIKTVPPLSVKLFSSSLPW